MNAVIIPFPCGRRDRARATVSDLLRQTTDVLNGRSVAETVILRVRELGYGLALSGFEREQVVRAAQNWLNFGLPEDEVMKRAHAMAKRLATTPRGPDGPRAA